MTGVYVMRPRLSILSYSAMLEGKWPGGGGKDYCWYRFGEKSGGRQITLDNLHRDTSLDTREAWTWWKS